MECITPVWLTKKYIEEVLQNHYSENTTIKVSDIKIESPVAKGNNNSGEILQVNVSYSKNDEPLTTSLIIKAPREDSAFVAEVLVDEVAAKESRMYNEFLPKLNKILTLHDIKLVTANSYYTDLKNVVILEDLKLTGYKMVDRVKQLDFAHAELTLKAIAIFHAASYVLHEQEPTFIEDIGKDFLFSRAKKDSGLEKMFKTTMKIFSEELETIPELSKFSNRMKEYACSRAWEELVNTMKTKPNEFTVLIRGDCHIANLMFKHNLNQVPISVKLIDLQGPQYTSPAIDILFFLYTSVRNDILKINFDKFMNIYLEELNEKLKKFGSQRILSREELDKQIHDRLPYLMFVNITALPWVLADPVNSELVSVDDAISDKKDNPLKLHYRTKLYRNVITERLIELFNKDCF